jgi:stress-induced morphogen
MSSDFLFVENIIRSGLPDAQVTVEDMTGTRDHLDITVVSDGFKGKLLIDQHQILMNLLKEELKDRIHAVKLTTMTWEKFQKLKQG